MWGLIGSHRRHRPRARTRAREGRDQGRLGFCNFPGRARTRGERTNPGALGPDHLDATHPTKRAIGAAPGRAPSNVDAKTRRVVRSPAGAGRRKSLAAGARSKFPATPLKIPCFVAWEFCCKLLNLLPDWAPKSQPRAGFQQDSLLISLLIREFELETGSIGTASTANQSLFLRREPGACATGGSVCVSQNRGRRPGFRRLSLRANFGVSFPRAHGVSCTARDHHCCEAVPRSARSSKKAQRPNPNAAR
jgi:hypothetical protein